MEARLKRTLVLSVAFLVACKPSKDDTSAPDESLPTGPTPASMGECVDKIDAWIQVPNKPPEERDPQWAAIRKECGVLYKQCGGPQTSVAFIRGGNRGLVIDLAGKCIETYCGGFSAPKPKLCNSGTALLTDGDQGVAAEASTEFHAAMVAADFGEGDSWAPLSARLSELWQGYGEVDMGGLGSAEALNFTVTITGSGFVLATSSPHKWVAKGGDMTKGVTLAMTPGAKKSPPAHDYAALAAEAKALKAAFAEEWSVTVVIDGEVDNDVQLKAMNALRGEGCPLEADASPSTIPAGCLFWRQTLR